MPDQETHPISQARSRAEMSDDAIDLLLSQHRQVRRLFDVYAKEKGEGKRETSQRISDVLILHAKLEEEIFYPAMQRLGDPEIKRRVEESLREHREAKDILFRLAGHTPSGSEFESLMQQLEDDVLHHIEEEESDLLPQARNRLRDPEGMAREMAAWTQEFDPAEIRNQWLTNGSVD